MSQDSDNRDTITPSTDNNSVLSPQSSSPSTHPLDLSAPPPAPAPIDTVVSESFREFPIQNTSLPPNSLTDQQLRVIDLLITGTTLTEAAAAVGVTVRTIYNWRHRDSAFATEYDTRRQMVWDQSLREMRDLIAPAVRVFAEQLRNRHEYPRYRAANAILRIAGVKKALANVQDSNEPAHARVTKPPAPLNAPPHTLSQAPSGPSPSQNPAQLAAADGSPRSTRASGNA